MAVRNGAGSGKLSWGQRVVSTTGGGVLLLMLLLLWQPARSLLMRGLRPRFLLRLLLAAVSAGLLYQGLVGRDLGRMARRGRLPTAADCTLEVRNTLTIRRPPAEVYRTWRSLDTLPMLMRDVRAVQRQGDGRSHWVAAGPRRMALKWDAQITEDVPGELIAWQTLPGGKIAHRGSVRFAPTTDGQGTTVQLALAFAPPGGALGRAAARALRPLVEEKLGEQLADFGRRMEVRAQTG